uniref:Type IV pilin N-term methylation site GFxxxE n=1 Tax=uncultured Thiotrichaceae bacterium TaxID=298394 RepID=A0A6S6UJS5_9GAMM|nr:MAG: Type IV pilin N-term methylation site GFxxxE [uncultured Thiotrichaceae bacterium]
MRSQQSSRGFTLLEMLIAFSMMSLLFLALFSSFNTIARGWDAADKKMLKTEDMRLISEFLRSQLSQAMVVRVQGDDGSVYAFEGEDYFVRYAAPLQPLQNSGGVYLIELAVGVDAGGKKLEMRYAPYRPDLSWDDALSEVEPVLVYGGLSSVRFEYFAADNVDDEPGWEYEWMDKPVYPLLLKVILEDKDQRVWPELIVDLPQVDEYMNAVAVGVK